MEYIKLSSYSYNLHIVKTNKFKTVTFQVNFKRKLEKEEITYRNMIINNLCDSNKLYPTKRLMRIKTEELYELYYSGMNYISGKYNIMNISSTFLNEKYTERGMLDESIKFISNLIFNPNIKDNKFDEKSFNMSYNLLKDSINSQKESPDSYSKIRLLEVMCPNSYTSYRPVGYIEDLDKINEENLYEYYKSIIAKDIIDIFVIGDVDEKRINDIVVKYFDKFKTIKKPSSTHFIESDKPRLIPQKVIEKQNINQSKLYLGFKIDKMTDFELRYVLNVYSYILGGGPNSKLFRVVREKNSMCYYISASGVALNSLLIIKAGINSKSFKKCVSLIKKEVNNMRLGMFNDDDISSAKITYENSMKELEDNPESIISLYAGMEYLGGDTIENRIININKVEKKDIINLSKKIHLDTIYLLEGDKNDKE